MTEPNWDATTGEIPPAPTDAPPLAAPIPDVVDPTPTPVATAPETVNPDAPRRGRGRPPLTDAQKAARKIALAAKARSRRAAATPTPTKRTAVAATANGSKRGRPARATAPTASASDNPVLEAIRADAARLRDKIFAAVISGTL